jgi:hypothetical protein
LQIELCFAPTCIIACEMLAILLAFCVFFSLGLAQQTDTTSTPSRVVERFTYISWHLPTPTPTPPPTPLIKWIAYNDSHCQSYLGEFTGFYPTNFTGCQPFLGNSIVIEYTVTMVSGEGQNEQGWVPGSKLSRML